MIGLDREKAHSNKLCHGGIKAREKLYSVFSQGFFVLYHEFGGVFMNREWIKVFVAAFLEVFWVIGLAHAYDFWTWTGTFIALIISNYLMITAGQVLLLERSMLFLSD